ncbi:MAG TPA: tetratricopeptide repeat protein [Terriglobia bacterium]|nr:tetratricopeptide repeat protein [Terriglobia bacterium]
MISGQTAFSSYAGRRRPAVCRLGPCVLLSLFLSVSSLICLEGQEKVRSHQERFATSADKSRRTEAEATARLNRNPKDVKGFTERGLARLGLGLIDAGVADLEQAVAVDRTSAESWASLAFGLWRQGRFEPALDAARAALERDPEQSSAHWYSGRLLLLTHGDVQEAVRHLERAQELNPAEAGIHLDLLMAYRATGDLKRAWAQLHPLGVLLPSSDTRLLGFPFQARPESAQGSQGMLSEIREALKAGRTAEGLGAVKDYERQFQNDSQALFDLAMLMSENSQHEAAAREFARINELRPHSPDILYNLGVPYYNLKR